MGDRAPLPNRALARWPTSVRTRGDTSTVPASASAAWQPAASGAFLSEAAISPDLSATRRPPAARPRPAAPLEHRPVERLVPHAAGHGREVNALPDDLGLRDAA